MHYAIIGAGPAGVTAAETLRSRDPEGEITLIGGEPEPVYSRMAIPYLLAGDIDEAGTYLRHDPAHFETLGIRHVQDRVTAIDSSGRRLTLSGGADLGYDRLLIASGSRAVAPPLEGLEQAGIHHCWTLEDARNIALYARPGSRVVLMGAGFIGCIIMEALVRRGVSLTLVEAGDRMVPRMMDQVAGNLIRTWCQGRGVDVRTSTRITAIDSDPSGAARFHLACDTGEALAADLLVVATGVRPAIDYLQGSGIETDVGVLVDERLQTSVPGVYAAGDVCQGMDWGSSGRSVHAIQPVAVETGRLAAINMSGGEVPHAGSMDMNVLDALGLICTSYGRWMGAEGGDSAELLDADGYRYIKLQFEDDRLVGAITLGHREHVGVLRGLIQSRVRLGPWKARLQRDPNRIMEAWLASTQP